MPCTLLATMDTQRLSSFCWTPNGVDIKAPTTSDALHPACFMGHSEVIKHLLDNGADVNVEQAINSLNIRLEEGHTHIVVLMLDMIENLNAMDALIDACNRGDTEIVQLLFDKGLGVDMNANAQQVLNGWKIACKQGHTKIICQASQGNRWQCLASIKSFGSCMSTGSH